MCLPYFHIISILRYFKVLLVYASSFSLFSQYWFTALYTVFFHHNFPGGFSKRSWDDDKSYWSRISDTSINQLWDFLDLTANWRWANSHSTVPKSLIIFPKVVNALLCISPVIGICPSNKYVAASEVLSGRCWICYSNLLKYMLMAVRSAAVIQIVSKPYISLGITYIRIICIETFGLSLFSPCNPAPINAYEVFLVVLILSSVTHFEEYFELQSRTIPRCVALSSVVKTLLLIHTSSLSRLGPKWTDRFGFTYRIVFPVCIVFLNWQHGL